MKKLNILFLLFSLSVSNVYAQFVADNMGRPLRGSRYVDISGSPYFNDKFQKGIVNFGSAGKDANVFIQYDQVADLLTYKDKLESESVNEFVTIVSGFKIVNNSSGDTTSFTNIPDQGKTVFYQVIETGKFFTFLVKEFKKIVDVTSYNTANKEKRVTANVKYFGLNKEKGSLYPLSLDKKSIHAFFVGNETTVDDFMSKNKYNYKDKIHISLLFDYMNTK